MSYSLVDSENTRVLIVNGALDALSSPNLRPTLDALTQEKGRNIRVDLSGLTLLDSSGVAALVSLYKRTRANCGSLTVVGVTDQPLCVFKVLGLDRIFAMT
jgi:anti-sigma B factor antagonist